MSPPQTLDTLSIQKRIKILLWFFISCLVLSGLTAFPLGYEINILFNIVGPETQLGQSWPAMAEWISFVNTGIVETNKQYPFIFYGTDWLAFAHIVIAIAFIGPLRDPVKNIWVIEFAMIACDDNHGIIQLSRTTHTINQLSKAMINFRDIGIITCCRFASLAIRIMRP